MPIRINKKLRKLIFLEKVTPIYLKMVRRVIKSLISQTILKGISPVFQRSADPKNTGGKNRYQKYSTSYIKQMGKTTYLANKKQSPRNLKVKGDLLNSITATFEGDHVKVTFTDDKAKYHNEEGAGKSKVIRRILPKDGERWSNSIEKTLRKIFAVALKKAKR